VVRSAAYLGDVLLADRCREGEEAAASELFRLHQGRVHAVLYRLLGNSAEIEDLLQDTFIQVFRSLGGYRGEAKLATWIDRIAARVAYRHLRRKRRGLETSTLFGDEFASAGPAPIDQAVAREGIKRLYQVLDGLSASQRIAFALFEIDGRSVAEVAELTACARTTAKLRIWRGRRAVIKAAQSDPVLAEFLADVELGAPTLGEEASG
jgi:RNA polymerase sigma-70 factor (ECF subfamily)